MDVVTSGRQHTLSPDIELACAHFSGLSAGWARNVVFALFSYEKVRRVEPRVDNWMVLAQTGVEGALIREDGPILPKELGPYVENGGEILEGKYATDCASVEDSKFSGRS
jgi:hypothetical protein